MAVKYAPSRKTKTKQQETSAARLLHSVTLRDFLSYGSGGQEVILRPLNVVIGPNGSGKSNLIEAFDLLRATRSDLSLRISKGGGIREWLWKGAATTPKASIQAAVEYPGKPTLNYVLEFGVLDEGMEIARERIWNEHRTFYDERPGDPDYIPEPMSEEDRGFGPRSGNLRQSILAQLREPRQHPEITYLGDTFPTFSIFKFQDLSVGATLRGSQPADLPKDFLLEDASNLALILNDFDHRRAPLDEVREKLKSFNPLIEDLRLSVYAGAIQVFIYERGFRSPVPAARLSDGTLRYLCLLAVLCHPEPPPLLCIEEPEIGLHPDVLPAVAELLIKASERTQLIVTTHSDTLVSALWETPESVIICERLKSGTRLKRLDPARLREWLEDYSLGDLWRMGEIGGD
jgi:predicted ATPase